MARAMLIDAALRCSEETLSADVWPMAMDYSIWIYNRITDFQSVLSAIEICSRSWFEPLS